MKPCVGPAERQNSLRGKPLAEIRTIDVIGDDVECAAVSTNRLIKDMLQAEDAKQNYQQDQEHSSRRPFCTTKPRSHANHKPLQVSYSSASLVMFEGCLLARHARR